MSLRTYNYRGTGRFRAARLARASEESPQRFNRATRNGLLLQRLDDPTQMEVIGPNNRDRVDQLQGNAVLVSPEISYLPTVLLPEMVHVLNTCSSGRTHNTRRSLRRPNAEPMVRMTFFPTRDYS